MEHYPNNNNHRNNDNQDNPNNNNNNNKKKSKLTLSERCEHFFKEDQIWMEKYPTISALLTILRVVHSVLLPLLEENTPTTEKRAMLKHLQGVLALLRPFLRDEWVDVRNDNLRHLLAAFVRSTTVIFESSLTSVAVVSTELLELLVSILEKRDEKQLEELERWASTGQAQLFNILRSDSFRSVISAATGAGTFVVGANASLWILGFSSAGIVKGSIAAGWMSTLGPGPLLSALQSAGVIGFGIATTAAIAIAGGVFGGVLYVLYKYATKVSEYHVNVYLERSGVVDGDPITVMYYSNTTLHKLIAAYLPVEIILPPPSSVPEIMIRLYNPKTREYRSIAYRDLERNARDVLSTTWSLVILRRDPSLPHNTVQFYIRRRGEDNWEIVKNDNPGNF